MAYKPQIKNGQPKNTMKPKELAKVGRRLVAIREALGHNQTDWAAKLGVSKSRLCRWENGQYEPDLGVLIVIVGFCRVSLDWILTGREHLEIQPQTLVFLQQTVPELFETEPLAPAILP